MPGEPKARLAILREKEGIPVSRSILADLRKTASDYSVRAWR
jgi:LDH2 family malate/lactate/ureidoglycolate dehydrogenase